MVIERTRAHEYSKADRAGFDQDFRFLAATHADKYDYSDRFDWLEVWADVGEFSHSVGWKQTLATLKQRLGKLDASEVHNEPFWQEVFDKINGQFKQFRFQKHKTSEGLFETVLGQGGRRRQNLGLRKNLENIVISSYVMLAGWSSAYIKTTPLELELKATRFLRKGKKICADIG